MANEGSVISNVVFWTGLHRVEVIRFGQAVDEELWIKKLVPDRCLETVTCFDWVEEPGTLNLHHLFINWKQRGAVRYSSWKDAELPNELVPPVDRAVLWNVEPGEGLYFSIDVAATLYKHVFGEMPSAAWVRMLPRGSKKKIEVGEGEDQGFLELMTGEWVPERFVVVGVSR